MSNLKINFNIGLLGHVDSGKTTLARALSTISSTAAFDKNPQSKERGITLDLGFSALTIETPNHLQSLPSITKHIQFTFVDCPGHASLIRTIIGGAQIIDLMILVIDAQKGIQTQTAECIVIGEILQKKLIVVINKIDMIEESKRQDYLDKMKMKLKKILSRTIFQDVPIFCISALNGINLKEFVEDIKTILHIPDRDYKQPLLIYIDHCFAIKGQGTVCTGTIIQGKVSINDTIELPAIKEQRKVKSIQMFKSPVQSAGQGDRIGLCVTQFNSNQMERGIICQPGYLKFIHAAVIKLNRIEYYKFPLKSKSKLHVTVGHETVMAKIILFKDNSLDRPFDITQEYEYVEELLLDEKLITDHFVMLEFETPILANDSSILIASKLDLDVHANTCRLACWGSIEWLTHSSNYSTEILPKFKIYRNKLKQGTIQRVVNDNQIIVQNLFKKDGNRDVYVGKRIELSTGECGVIESTFGQTSKVKINFPEGLREETLNLLKTKQNTVMVLLKFKKYIFNKKLGIIQ
ncbi:selenocysteine-specific elongation factor [Episyrphus balteatus]|uniref:selenocysteine-specific elongation factor n=1 Tax=Episyrphus balteatus TaxID=286459 RepID=UPI0024866C37|nr:selenocysteine-specific elongation factor [Episyrphus balteatus]